MFVSRAVRYMWLLTMIHGYVIRPPSRITNRLGFITGTTSDLRGDNWSLQRVRMTPDTAEQEEPLSNSEKGSNDIDVEVNAALDDDSPVNSSENDEDDSATSNVTNVNEPSTEDHIDENQQQQQQQQQPNDKDVVMEDEVKEPEEDAELIALKEEIKAAETLLKEKRRQLSYVADEAEEYTQAGYARKVAEMENMRRARSMMNSSSRAGATAAVLSKFLPVIDTLSGLRERYGEDNFGRQYNTLAGEMRGAFTKLGVTEYTTVTGERIDSMRMSVISAEHSSEYPIDTVIRPVSMGMELQGNVIRMAECVGSLGPVNTGGDERSAEDPNDVTSTEQEHRPAGDESPQS